MTSIGKVWLVGAGPGDLGLFTMKGLQILQQADVVVYDSLVGQGVLSQIPRTAHCINVGKRASNHTMPQEKINEVLVQEAKKGQRVVRLKVVILSCLAGGEKSWNFWCRKAFLMRLFQG